MARRYARDNRGRFSSTGATARGGRLRTAAGNKRATQTTKLSGDKAGGTVAKPKRLKPQSASKLRTGIAVNRMRSINERIGKGPDLAQTNIKGRFSGQAGKRMDASISRAAKQVKAAEQARLMKPKAQVKAERAARAEANRAAQAAKPKRIRSAESLRTSRAKQIEKRRSITTNPAGERASAASKMAANAARTQQRATAFYKANASKKSASAAPNPAAKPVPKSATSLQAVNARRARASAPRTSTYLSQKLNTQSAITRSAANAIYNRQRAVSKAGGLDKSVVRNPIGIMPKTSGSVRNRASQVREAARKRVVGGRRR
jgi:hypothetical protein